MSTAPYTLIDFPTHAQVGKPLLAQQLWAGHAGDRLLGSRDRYLPETRSGWVDVTATTLTPLFIGGAGTERVGNRTVHVPTRLPDGTPIIPDSSLQGMLRHYLRVLTGGRVGPINKPVLFFRAPVPPNQHAQDHAADVTRVKHAQYLRRTGGAESLRPGLLSYNSSGAAAIRPTGKVFSIPLTALRTQLARRDDPARAHVQLGTLPHTATATYIPRQHTGAALGQRVFAAIHNTRRNPGHAPTFVDTHAVVAVTTLTDRQSAVATLQQVAAQQTPPVQPTEYGVREVIIWITGRIGPNRNNAYLFPATGLQPGLPVPDETIRLLESAEQITHWQEQNFPVGSGVQRRIKGALDTAPGHDQPVWFTRGRRDNTTVVTSFGRSGGYRVTCAPTPIHGGEPIPHVLLDAIPEALRPLTTTTTVDTIDVPDALLGTISWGGTDTGLPRRVHCSTLAASGGVEPIDPIHVQLLSAQRGCFVNYLLQPTQGDIITYASEDAHLRGYKQYWHRWHTDWDADLQAHLPEIAGQGEGTDRWIAPLPPGVTFHGRITFTNLTDPELGALLAALQLANTDNESDNPISAHKIGMGKALGLGSVHLATTVHLTDPHTRYLTWPTPPPTVPDPDQTAAIIDAFNAIHIAHTQSLSANSRDRIRKFHAATSWRDRPASGQTAPMVLDAYKALEILPDTLDVINPGNGHT